MANWFLFAAGRKREKRGKHWATPFSRNYHFKNIVYSCPEKRRRREKKAQKKNSELYYTSVTNGDRVVKVLCTLNVHCTVVCSYKRRKLSGFCWHMINIQHMKNWEHESAILYSGLCIIHTRVGGTFYFCFVLPVFVCFFALNSVLLYFFFLPPPGSPFLICANDETMAWVSSPCRGFVISKN